MQSARQILEAMEIGVSFDAIFMQLVEGVNKSTANTIGIEIEMAIDQEENANVRIGQFEVNVLHKQYQILVALKTGFAISIINLNTHLKDYTSALDFEDVQKFAKDLLRILEDVHSETERFDEIIIELQNRGMEEEADLIITMLDGSSSISSDAQNFVWELGEIIGALKEQDERADALDKLGRLVKKLNANSGNSLHIFNDSLTRHTVTDRQLHSLMHPEPEEGANAWQEFRRAFGAIGWEVKDDSSIKPFGLEAVTPDKGLPITDIARIKEGFAVAEKLHEQGWHFNDTTGVHFHLGVNKNIDFFYIIAMIALFYQKESFIFANFPMRTKNRFAHSVEDIVKKVHTKLADLFATGNKEPAVELTDHELQQILDSLPKTQGDRYFGVNARPSLQKHGTIELRYFHGQPLLDDPNLLAKLIALFRSIMHEAQTSRYFAVPGEKGAQKLMLERDAQDRIWIKSEINRKEIPNKKLPIVPKYIAPKGTTLSVYRPGVDDDAIYAKRMGANPEKKYQPPELVKVKSHLRALFRTHAQINVEWLDAFSVVVSDAITYVWHDPLFLNHMRTEIEVLQKLRNALAETSSAIMHSVVRDEVEHNAIKILKNLLDILTNDMHLEN